jgi:hypothetical protein
MVGFISSFSRFKVKVVILCYYHSMILSLSIILVDFIEDFSVTIQKIMCNVLRLDDMHASLPGLKYRSLLFDAPSS